MSLVIFEWLGDARPLASLRGKARPTSAAELGGPSRNGSRLEGKREPEN